MLKLPLELLSCYQFGITVGLKHKTRLILIWAANKTYCYEKDEI